MLPIAHEVAATKAELGIISKTERHYKNEYEKVQLSYFQVYSEFFVIHKHVLRPNKSISNDD